MARGKKAPAESRAPQAASLIVLPPSEPDAVLDALVEFFGRGGDSSAAFDVSVTVPDRAYFGRDHPNPYISLHRFRIITEDAELFSD